METNWPVVAAIDFGTHGTGYAWIEVMPDNREAVRRIPHIQDRWPGTRQFYPKTLTALLLDPDGNVIEWGHQAKIEWIRLSQENAHEGYSYVSGFKMALRADAFQGRRPPGVGAITVDTPQKAYPLIVEYLRRMYQTALAEIQLSGYLEEQIRWCVTVPAIWDNDDKALMRRAAEEAGMPGEPDRLLLAIEPEAAALQCQVHLTRVLGSDEKINLATDARRFMVVDCGGGTVDITAFRIDRSSGQPHFIEIGKVSGGKLGSEYINQAFIDEVLRDRFGGEAAVEQIRAACPHALAELVDDWESAKVSASVVLDDSGSPAFERPVYLRMPSEILDILTPEARSRLLALPLHSAHRLVVSTEECQRLFDRVTVKIIEIVEDQLAEIVAHDGPSKEPERLLLVGGMSAAEYLQQRMQQTFAHRALIMVPSEPAAAVLFGAVHYAYEPEVVVARRSRYTYGCEVAMPFENKLDPVAKQRNGPDGESYCYERFQIFVRNGQTVEVDEAHTYRVHPLFPDQSEVTIGFFRAPGAEPRYTDDDGCEKVGSILVAMGTAMDLPHAERHIDVRMHFGKTEIDAAGTNVHTGEAVTTSLKFDSSY